MTEKSELGRLGEDFAVGYLKQNGYKVIERNFRRSWGELDIVVMAEDKTLVFVEVKTMKNFNESGLRPEDQMTKAKIRKFKKAALYAGYNQKLINDEKGWRLDLIALIKIGNDFHIKHYKNII